MISWALVHIIAIVAGLGFVMTLQAKSALGGALSRGFAGGAVTIGANSLFRGFLPVESFVNACLNGSLGYAGVFFLISIGYLLTIWIMNMITIRRLIQ